jgi:putative DNA methylase
LGLHRLGARTARPNSGGSIGKALRHSVLTRKGQPAVVHFEVFAPKGDREVPPGTVARAKATCIACGDVLAPERVRAQLAMQRGGADVVFDRTGNRTGGARLLAVVTLEMNKDGRQYRIEREEDYSAVYRAQRRLAATTPEKREDRLSAIPDEPLPPIGTLGFRVQRYGMLQWGDLFSARQKLGLLALAQGVEKAMVSHPELGSLPALALSRYTDIFNALCGWESGKNQVRHLFVRQAIPMIWDFAEGGYLGGQAGDFGVTLETMAEVVGRIPNRLLAGTTQLADATRSPVPDSSAACFFTDPPYYDAIPYSDLSDFFFVWLKRSLPADPMIRDPFDSDNPLTPKSAEAVQDESRTFNGRPKDRKYFEDAMAQAFAEGRRVLTDDGIGSVVFAHKTTEGWEALLGGLVKGGWTITGSWPISTEMPTRLRARESAALSASVHLVCRPRAGDAPVGDWADVVRELPRRVGDWMERLSGEGVRGADLVFACIGPAMEVNAGCAYSPIPDAVGRRPVASDLSA